MFCVIAGCRMIWFTRERELLFDPVFVFSVGLGG